MLVTIWSNTAFDKRLQDVHFNKTLYFVSYSSPSPKMIRFNLTNYRTVCATIPKIKKIPHANYR